MTVPFAHEPGERRGWTHESCWDCWWDQHPYEYIDGELQISRWPVVQKDAPTVICCLCGQPNRSGIFVRADPGDLDLACSALDTPGSGSTPGQEGHEDL